MLRWWGLLALGVCQLSHAGLYISPVDSGQIVYGAPLRYKVQSQLPNSQPAYGENIPLQQLMSALFPRAKIRYPSDKQQLNNLPVSFYGGHNAASIVAILSQRYGLDFIFDNSNQTIEVSLR